MAAGYQPGDWPADSVATELPRVIAVMARRPDAPRMTLTTAAVVCIHARPVVEVTGAPAAILAWLSGRSGGSELAAASEPPGATEPLRDYSPESNVGGASLG